MSGREGYHSSSVSCWDRQFDYGQHRRCGVPHFITGTIGKEWWGGTHMAGSDSNEHTKEISYNIPMPTYQRIVVLPSKKLYYMCCKVPKYLCQDRVETSR